MEHNTVKYCIPGSWIGICSLMKFSPPPSVFPFVSRIHTPNKISNVCFASVFFNWFFEKWKNIPEYVRHPPGCIFCEIMQKQMLSIYKTIFCMLLVSPLQTWKFWRLVVRLLNFPPDFAKITFSESDKFSIWVKSIRKWKNIANLLTFSENKKHCLA